MRIPSASGKESPIPEDARKTQEQLKRLAWLLDNSIRLPGGFRVGVDALIGLVPFLGDLAGVLLSGYIVSQSARLGVPRSVLLRMALNVGVEGLVGIFPFVGDLFDAAWKANQRNVELLGRHLENPAHTARSSRRVVGAVVAALILFLVGLSVLSALIVRWIWLAVQG